MLKLWGPDSQLRKDWQSRPRACRRTGFRSQPGKILLAAMKKKNLFMQSVQGMVGTQRARQSLIRGTLTATAKKGGEVFIHKKPKNWTCVLYGWPPSPLWKIGAFKDIKNERQIQHLISVSRGLSICRMRPKSRTSDLHGRSTHLSRRGMPTQEGGTRGR